MKTLDSRMLTAVSYAIADLIDKEHLKEDYIVPKMNDPRIISVVAIAIKKFALANRRSSQEAQIG